MARIFISYRRDDSEVETGRIYDRLESHFGRDSVFMDVDDIPLGVDFRAYLDEQIRTCDALLAVIGSHWLNLGDEGKGRRIDAPQDYVRTEIELALERGIPVIPILLRGVTMPRESDLPHSIASLAYRNAAQVDPGAGFRMHIDRLIRGLEQLVEKSPAIAVDRPPASSVPERVLTPTPSRQAPKVAEPEVERPRAPSKNRRAPAGKAQSPGVPEPEMVRIEPGRFLMGSAKGFLFLSLFRAEGYAEELPQHAVRIARPFAMGRYPVTFEEYEAFAKAAKPKVPDDWNWGRGRRPVINVSWEDAVAYAQWLSEQTGKRYRLPTEAEWEYATRAGTSTPWSFGDDEHSVDEHAWYGGNADSKTHPVGEKASNPWGLHDVHGNVWEWVQDCWHGNYEGAPTDGSAWQEEGGGNCGRRVVRGGFWSTDPEHLRSASRTWDGSGARRDHLGFRLAQDL